MIKIDVITGFLGAGKTTFMKMLLEKGAFADEKIVIIENEFGDVPIDHYSLENPLYSVVEISGGCICCSLKVDIIQALASIAEKEKPDRILIEPSGIFIVEDLFEILNNQLIDQKFALNGIYTIVDAAHFLIDQMRHAPFFKSQLTYASHIVLSKVAQESDEVLASVLEGLMTYNNKAKYYALPYEVLEKADLEAMFYNDDTLYTSMGKAYVEGLITAKPVGSHKPMLSVGINKVKTFIKEEFEGFIDAVNLGKYGEIVRLKGYIMINDQRYLVNYVSGEITYEAVSEGVSRLTVIGLNLQVLKLRKGLTAFNFRRD